LSRFINNIALLKKKVSRGNGKTSGMKKHIREMIDDLKSARHKDYIPPVPKGAAKESMQDLTPPPVKTTPDDLSNEELSTDPAERVKQLDYQAFESERLQTNS